MGADGELIGDDEQLTLHADTTEDDLVRRRHEQELLALGVVPRRCCSDFIGRVRRGDASDGPLDEALYVARVIARAYESSIEKRARPLTAEAPAASTVPLALSRVTEAVSRAVEEPSTGSPAPAPVETARRTPRAARVAGVVMLAAALGWVIHDVEWTGLVSIAATVDPLWITLAAAANIAAVYAMAVRWKALLRPLSSQVGVADAFRAMVVGFAVSLVVPARGGELARAEWLGRRTGLPRATILGTILLDHLVNAAGMFVGIAALPFVLDLPLWLHSAIWIAVVVFASALGVVLLLRPRPGRPLPEARRSRVERVGDAVSGFLARARLGLSAVRDRRALLRSFAASLAAWVLEIQVVFFCLRAFEIHVPFGIALLVLMAVNLALVVPFAPPGNFGTLEIGATLGLMEAGVPKDHALAFALSYHFLQVIPLAFGGLALAGRSLLQGGHAPAEETRSS